MAVGPRQERIGNLPVAGEQQSAQPSADITRQVASTKRQAEAAANRRQAEAAGVLRSPQGSGPAPGSKVAAPARQVGAGGSMFEWDSGLAINDVEGGGSG